MAERAARNANSGAGLKRRNAALAALLAGVVGAMFVVAVSVTVAVHYLELHHVLVLQ